MFIEKQSLCVQQQGNPKASISKTQRKTFRARISLLVARSLSFVCCHNSGMTQTTNCEHEFSCLCLHLNISKYEIVKFNKVPKVKTVQSFNRSRKISFLCNISR